MVTVPGAGRLGPVGSAGIRAPGGVGRLRGWNAWAAALLPAGRPQLSGVVGRRQPPTPRIVAMTTLPVHPGADAVLDPLDPEQREVAAHPSGPMCVLAGAGTGKTRAITHRIAYGVLSGV